MRKPGEKKKGALTLDECLEKAARLIEENGICMFIVDIKGSTNYGTESNVDYFKELFRFTKEVSEKYDSLFPVNHLSIGPSRTEKGFEYGLGDARWAGVDSIETIKLIHEYKEKNFPNLPLYYGVAADGWSEGIELIK